MSAPDRIWAMPSDDGWMSPYCGNAPHDGSTEYLRADLCDPQDARVKALEAENARLREALSLYSCDDGCNDCPEHERDRVGCGWTALRALEQGNP